MNDGFADMIATASQFFGELAANNNRDWFEGHKPLFKSQIEAPLKLLTDVFAEDVTRLTGKGHAGKVGRIYRDVRFAKDKSPYNTHVHAYWTVTGETGPGWLLHIDAAGARLMTGLHDLNPDGLARYRAAVDRDGDALQDAIDVGRTNGANLVEFGDSMLKRVPKPFDPDHPHGDLLRRRQIALEMALTGARLRDGVMPALCSVAATLRPFWAWCDTAIA